MKTTFVRKESQAKNIFSFYFSKPAHMHHIAGQFVELHLPHEQIDDRGKHRWFTLSSSPSEELLAITTRLSNQSSSFKSTLHSLKPGDEVTIYEPMGDFVLPKHPHLPLLFAAIGIGCTPFRSIITSLIDSRQSRDITLLYAAPAEEMLFKPVFASLGEKFIPLFDEKLTSEIILNEARRKHNTYIFLSGPEKAVEVLQKELIENGYDKSLILVDFFHGYAK